MKPTQPETMKKGSTNKRMFVAKYLGPTDFLGSRFSITDTRHRGVRKTYSWNYALGYLTDQALHVLKKQGIEIMGYSEPWTENDKVYLFSDNFSTPLS